MMTIDVILGLTAMIQIWKWPKPVTTLHIWIMVDSSMMVKLHANNVFVLCLCPWITYLQRIPDVSCMRKFLSFYNWDWIKNSEWIKNSTAEKNEKVCRDLTDHVAPEWSIHFVLFPCYFYEEKTLLIFL